MTPGTARSVPGAGKPYPPPPQHEPLWPAQASLLAAIGLQLGTARRLAVGPFWLMPALEGALLVVLVVASPAKIAAEHGGRRAIAVALTGLVTGANIYSLVVLSRELLHHRVHNGDQLIVSGTLIWLTNVLIFALWYWEADRGGPGRRAAGHDGAPDFLFVQMNDDAITSAAWRPHFIDYLYVSLTNATAFSPTDTMPLTPMSKSIMGVQSLVSLVTIGLVVARAVNILA